jgi:RNA polymerase sigma factor for flagellar operon FliA
MTPHRAHALYGATGSPADEEAALVMRHAALIDRAARRIAGRTAGAVSPDDLWSAGAMGLLDAAKRYDGARDVKFETCPWPRIQGAMLDELRRMDHLPRRLRAQADGVERARARLSRTLQREPTAEELSAETGLDGEELASLAAVVRPERSEPDLLAAAGVAADDAVERGQLAASLAEAVRGLPERLQVLLSLHYVEGLTYREVAKVLGVSEPRVSQLHGEAVGRLREAMGRR